MTRRVITKSDLILHGFKQMDEDKNIWLSVVQSGILMIQ